MASFYELSERQVYIILCSLIFQRDRTWGEVLDCTLEELEALIEHMTTRTR